MRSSPSSAKSESISISSPFSNTNSSTRAVASRYPKTMYIPEALFTMGSSPPSVSPRNEVEDDRQQEESHLMPTSPYNYLNYSYDCTYNTNHHDAVNDESSLFCPTSSSTRTFLTASARRKMSPTLLLSDALAVLATGAHHDAVDDHEDNASTVDSNDFFTICPSFSSSLCPSMTESARHGYCQQSKRISRRSKNKRRKQQKTTEQ